MVPKQSTLAFGNSTSESHPKASGLLPVLRHHGEPTGINTVPLRTQTHMAEVVGPPFSKEGHALGSLHSPIDPVFLARASYETIG